MNIRSLAVIVLVAAAPAGALARTAVERLEPTRAAAAAETYRLAQGATNCDDLCPGKGCPTSCKTGPKRGDDDRKTRKDAAPSPSTQKPAPSKPKAGKGQDGR